MTIALIDQYSKSLPESFPGPMLDNLTNMGLRWRTIQNRRSRGEIPRDCFVRVSPRKVIILRDVFLEWLCADMARANHKQC